MEESYRIIKPYLRGLPLIVIAMILGILLAKKYLNYTTPMYESTAKLRLADVGEGVPNSNLFKDLDVFASSNKIAAEIEILKSQLLLDKMLDKLNIDIEINRIGKLKSVELFDNSPIIITYTNAKPKLFDTQYELAISNNTNIVITHPDSKEIYSGSIGKQMELPFGKIAINLNDSVFHTNPRLELNGKYTFRITSRPQLVNKIIKNLDIISVDKDVAVIRISYKDANPQKAALLVNTLAQTYIEDYIESKYKAAHVTVNFLDSQIDSVVKKLSKAENSIQSYRDTKAITNLTQETETDLRKISQLKIQQTNVKMSLDAIKQLDAYIQNGQNNFLELAPNFEAFTDLLSTEIVKKIKALQSEKKDLQLIYTNEDERVKVVDEKIADLTTYLTESISNTRKNLEVKYRDLSSDITDAEKVFIGVPEKEKMLNILNREFQIYQSSYNFLNQKKIDAEIAESAKIAFHRIITPGQISKEPVSPNKTIITILCALLSMFGAIFLIFIVHKVKAKVNSLHNIESNSNIAVAMLTPYLKNKKDIDQHFLKEAIQSELKGFISNKSILCFSEYKKNEGAKFNALHLSEALSLQDRKVLLLDVNNLLNSNYSISNNGIIHLKPNLDVSSLTDPSFNRFTKSAMNEYLEKFISEYDVIIILNESLDQDIKAKMMMSLANVNFVVMDTRKTPEKRIVETDLLNDEYEFPNIHFVLNRFGYNPSLLEDFRAIKKRFSQGRG